LKTTIQINDLSIGYLLGRGRQKLIQERISQQLCAGELTCLLGANGVGKSTLLRTLSGSQPPLKGEIIVHGRSLQAYPDNERARLIGLVLTDKTNVGGISVFDLVALGRHPYTGFFGRLKKSDREIVIASMEKVGILHHANSYVSELSDGERQKAMIAKALAQECPVILLDEPTAFLDVNSRIETMLLLQELAEKEQKSILISTHDIESAIRMGSCFWLMSKDKPFLSGKPEELILSGVFDDFFQLSAYPEWSGKRYLNEKTDC
jgi:iron complex transport system ATP-binding protein